MVSRRHESCRFMATVQNAVLKATDISVMTTLPHSLETVATHPDVNLTLSPTDSLL